MKPSELVPTGILLFIVSICWLYTILCNTDWYIEHVPNELLMGIIIVAALLMLFTSIILILSIFE